MQDWLVRKRRKRCRRRIFIYKSGLRDKGRSKPAEYAAIVSENVVRSQGGVHGVDMNVVSNHHSINRGLARKLPVQSPAWRLFRDVTVAQESV